MSVCDYGYGFKVMMSEKNNPPHHQSFVHSPGAGRPLMSDSERLAQKKRKRKAIKKIVISESVSAGMKEFPPSAAALRAWIKAKGLSSQDVADALRLSDGRVVRNWTSTKAPRPIPYPSWYTLRHKFGK